MNDTDRSRLIAKNSLLLYIRTFFVLLISLYTSRVILHTLGVTDYGVYNVVGGVVVMLGFLTNSLSGASSRYITYDLGTGDMRRMKKTFGNILSIHFIMAGVVILIAETAGLWFVTTRLQIPAGRENAAFWVYQCAILSSAVSLIGIPYNAAVIAHERMSAFACISIIDAVLKLVIVYMLHVIHSDRLIVYAFLLLGIQLFDRIAYGVYSTRNFEETRVRMSYNKTVFKEISAFSGWTMLGHVASIGFTQGLNMLLNIFFGPAVNAARAFAVQVQSACQQFCTNFQMALNPQLTKSYARGDLEYMHKLLVRSSKFSFFILYIIVLPLLLETPYVLGLWLGTPPDHTTAFVRLMLAVALLFTLSNPIIVSVHATGVIKKFQLVEGGILLMIVPVSYILLKLFRLPPASVFVVQIIIESITLFARLRITLPMIGMRMTDYFRQVTVPVLAVTVLSPVIPVVVFEHAEGGLRQFIMVCSVCMACTSMLIYGIGCTGSERKYLLEKIYAGVKRIKRH